LVEGNLGREGVWKWLGGAGVVVRKARAEGKTRRRSLKDGDLHWPFFSALVPPPVVPACNSSGGIQAAPSLPIPYHPE